MQTAERTFTERQQLIAKYASALSNPIRVAILELLANQSCCYHGDMAGEFSIANSTLSQHLKVLRQAGLIQGQITLPKTKYCINRENWNQAKELMAGFFE